MSHEATVLIATSAKKGLPPLSRRARRRRRRGYALLLVMIFVALFAAILGVAWRRAASVLRIERSSELRKQCDKGSIAVLAQAMTVLETRLRSNSANGVMFDGSTDSELEFKKEYPAGSGHWYKITFTRTSLGSATPTEWTVAASAITNDEALLITNNLPNDPI